MKTKRKFLSLVASLLIVISIPSFLPCCSYIVEATPRISMNKKTASLEVGETLSLKLKNSDKTPKWKSSDKKVATVTSKGKVTAKGPGNVTITASLSGKKYTCIITVIDAKDSTNNESTYVWATETGSKYHRQDGCGTTNSNRAREITLQEAEDLGLTPCSKCFK